MKTLWMLSLLFSLSALADDKKAEPKGTPVMTVKDAKKVCKDQGKKGPDLIKCIKEMKAEAEQ